jgi:alpha-ketoglutarate-dependent taurine dioxygenase
MRKSHKSYATLIDSNNPSHSSKLTSKDHVVVELLFRESPFPWVIRPALEGVDLLEWAGANKDFIEEKLERCGAVLFRGFKTSQVEKFQEFAEGFSPNGLIDYSFRSTPRSNVSGRIYTSTEYPADRSIPVHNEMSYTRSWPMKIWFYCVKPAAQGGATPIGNSAKVFQRIDPKVREKFEKHGVMYVRNYHDGIDLPYKEVFGTDNHAEIEQFCKGQGIECEFDNKGKLRTRQKCQATFVHPKTGESLWFNQAHLFHSSNLEPKQSAALMAMYGKDGIPRDCYYGDGSTIDKADLDVIREAYRQETVSFPWEEGDILMLDNLRIAHGRDSYSGERKIVMAMADKYEAGPVSI